jgi:hypothetical protein
MIKVQKWHGNCRTGMEKYVRAIATLKVGESFLYRMTSNHRNAISVIQYALGRKFRTRVENDKYRIARVE